MCSIGGAEATKNTFQRVEMMLDKAPRRSSDDR